MKVVPPKLTSYQKEILFSPARFTITESSTKAGKTFSHIVWLYGKAHERIDAKGRNYWWVAPVYSQTKIAYNRQKRYLAPTKLYRFNDSNLIIYCPNGAEIHYKSAEKPDNLYGEDVYAAVFDEAPRAREESWYALRTTLTATEGQCKLIGNFGGISNWVHRLKEDRKNDPMYAYFKVTCWDAIKEGILTEAEVLQAKKDLPEKIFKELYEAEASESDGQLINNESIQKLFSNTHIEGGVKYITADIARMGRDTTNIRLWDGFRSIETVVLKISKVNDSVQAIQALMQKHNVNKNNTIVDEDGVGGGVKDYLGCLGFVNGSQPIKVAGEKMHFANLKTQCYWKLAEKINRNEIYVKGDHTEQTMLTGELEMVRLAKEPDTAKIQLLSKDNVKKELGRSPDYSDSLMMRMYFELNPGYGKYSLH